MNFVLKCNSELADLFLHLLVVIPRLVNLVARTIASNLSFLSNSQPHPHSLSFQHSVEHRASCHLLLRHFSTRLGLIYSVVNDCLNWRHIIEEIENSDVARCLYYASPMMAQSLNYQSYSVDHQVSHSYLPLEHLIVNHQGPNL